MKRTYYLFSSGRLQRKDNTLFFYPVKTEADAPGETNGTEPEILAGTDEDPGFPSHIYDRAKKRVIPVDDVDSLVIFGELNFNSAFLNFTSSRNIPFHLFNYYGFYSGSYYPRDYLQSGFLMVNQVEHYQKKAKRLTIARAILEAASFNILKNLRYYHERTCDLSGCIRDIENLRESLPTISDIPELMGIEGNIRRRYYEAFPFILKEKYDFSHRVKRPPDNAVNALISFGNAMVYSACLTEIYRTQLSPLISFLHQPGERRYSLALDLAEIFKPLFADRILFSVLNKQMITEKDFDRNLNYCYLKQNGRKIFVKQFEEKMKTTIQHRALKRHVSYRRLIRLECYKLIKHLTGVENYEGFKTWW